MHITFEIPLEGLDDGVKTNGVMSIVLNMEGLLIMDVRQDREGALINRFKLRPTDLRSIMHALRTCQIQAGNEDLEQPRGYRDPRFP